MQINSVTYLLTYWHCVFIDVPVALPTLHNLHKLQVTTVHKFSIFV